LLNRDGARTVTFPAPEYARAITGRAMRDGFLATLDEFEVGWYAREGVRSGSLPAEWAESAVSEGGWVLAAQHRMQPMCALLFRPDSVLSTRGDAGVKSLRAALEWLAPHGMFAVEKTKEDT
jgi:anthranilate/para-aminobenzoate synthase component II